MLTNHHGSEDGGRDAHADKSATAPRHFSDPIGHLCPEAIAAYVDHEMDAKSMRRAEFHFARCAECRAEVVTQQGAAGILRRSTSTCPVHVPDALMTKLSQLGDAPLTSVPDGAGAGPLATEPTGVQPDDAQIDGTPADSAELQGRHLWSKFGALVRAFRNQNGQ